MESPMPRGVMSSSMCSGRSPGSASIVSSCAFWARMPPYVFTPVASPTKTMDTVAWMALSMRTSSRSKCCRVSRSGCSCIALMMACTGVLAPGTLTSSTACRPPASLSASRRWRLSTANGSASRPLPYSTPGILSVRRTARALDVPSVSRVSISSMTAFSRVDGDGSRRPLEKLVLALEDRRHRVVGEDVVDGLGEDPRDRENPDLLGPGRRIDGNGIADDDLLEHRLVQSLQRGLREHGMRGTGVDAARPRLVDRLGPRDERPGRVDHVVRDHAGLACHVADHVRDVHVA